MGTTPAANSGSSAGASDGVADARADGRAVGSPDGAPVQRSDVSGHACADECAVVDADADPLDAADHAAAEGRCTTSERPSEDHAATDPPPHNGAHAPPLAYADGRAVRPASHRQPDGQPVPRADERADGARGRRDDAADASAEPRLDGASEWQMWQAVGEPSPGADVAVGEPVQAQMWQGQAQSRGRGGQG